MTKSKNNTYTLSEEEREVMLELSELIHRERTEKNMSLEELAIASGRHKQHLYYMENCLDKRSPNFTSVIRILNVLGYKVEYVKK